MKVSMMRKKHFSFKKGVFFSSQPLWGLRAFQHCLRISEVMERVEQARRVLHKNQIPLPVWMFGLFDSSKSSSFSPQLMTFLLNMGFYDRFCRLFGPPPVLMGYGLPVLVAARFKTFERAVMEIVTGKEPLSGGNFRVYHKKTPASRRFSLLVSPGLNSFRIGPASAPFKQGGKNNHPLVRIPPACVLSAKKAGFPGSLKLKDWMDYDTSLVWLKPLLTRHRKQNPPPSL